MEKIWKDILSQFRDIRSRLNKLETWEPYSNSAPVSTADVSNPPTDAELDSAFGEPADLLDPYIAIVDDAGAGTTVWLVVATNGGWFYELLTQAV